MTAIYERDTLTFAEDYLDAEVEAGHAKFFATTKGPIYVLKLAGGGSIKVTSDMITRTTTPLVETVYSVPAASADLVAEADALGISVEEHTDGEYRDSRRTIADRHARMDALLGEWS